jgi:hypothetical protein
MATGQLALTVIRSSNCVNMLNVSSHQLVNVRSCACLHGCEWNCSCKLLQANCSAGFPEHVLLAACICPLIYKPVCGVNNVTYSNECEAGCAKVEVAYQGECRSGTRLA